MKSHTLVIFVVATTGQGDFPANARSFWRSLLLKRLPGDFLDGVQFASFGLGDSSYPKWVLFSLIHGLNGKKKLIDWVGQVQLGGAQTA